MKLTAAQRWLLSESDKELRGLERSFGLSDEDQLARLVNHYRRGELDPIRIRLASYLDYEPAHDLEEELGLVPISMHDCLLYTSPSPRDS